MLQYRGYVAKYRFDDVRSVFQGEVLETERVIRFESRSLEDLRVAFESAVEDYLDECDEDSWSD